MVAKATSAGGRCESRQVEESDGTDEDLLRVEGEGG